MNARFLIFLLIIAAIVTALVIFDLNRTDPWNSDVFFGQNDKTPIQVIWSFPENAYTV